MGLEAGLRLAPALRSRAGLRYPGQRRHASRPPPRLRGRHPRRRARTLASRSAPSAMRALVLGAETPAGRALAVALTDSGAQPALVASPGDAETAFAVQRLARRLGALSQAIDATNEMAVRVMVRQVAKALGGLGALFFRARPRSP